MSPVLTPFTADKKSVNCDVIDKYAQWLKQKGVHGVLVNGTISEGMCLTVEERKRTAEEWLKACRKYQMTLMVQITGAAVADAYALAEHAEKIGADAVLCLPELFFRPTSEEDLVHYLKEVAQHCPTRPLLYYHIPTFSGVHLSMARFCDLAEKAIPTFCGIEFANADLSLGSACLKPGRNVLLGADTVLCGALVLGFEAAIIWSVNICPELAIECFECIQNNKLREAQAAQVKLTKRVNEVLAQGGDWLNAISFLS